MMPRNTREDTTSPWELLTGRKVREKVDLKYSFGEYCQVHEPEMDNSPDLRNAGGLVQCSF
jgi:hypothetical protein